MVFDHNRYASSASKWGQIINSGGIRFADDHSLKSLESAECYNCDMQRYQNRTTKYRKEGEK